MISTTTLTQSPKLLASWRNISRKHSGSIDRVSQSYYRVDQCAIVNSGATCTDCQSIMAVISLGSRCVSFIIAERCGDSE